MAIDLESDSIKGFFTRSLRRCFEDLDIPREGVLEYLAELLTRYTAQSVVHPLGAGGQRIASIGDRVAEIQKAWTEGGPHWEPLREVSLRRGIGDYALFMHGFFWEHVRDMSARRHYLREGRRAYRFVAAHHRAWKRRDAAVYQALATRFDTYAAVLSYMRDVHLDGHFVPAPRTPPSTRFIVP